MSAGLGHLPYQSHRWSNSSLGPWLGGPGCGACINGACDGDTDSTKLACIVGRKLSGGKSNFAMMHGYKWIVV